MEPARYRTTDVEVETARLALEVLLKLDVLKTIAGREDPLADAARIAERVLCMALRASPIPEVALYVWQDLEEEAPNAGAASAEAACAAAAEAPSGKEASERAACADAKCTEAACADTPSGEPGSAVAPRPAIAVPRTVQEQRHLWHGPDALKNAEAATAVMRKQLDELSTAVFGLRSGPASERKDLVTHVVHAGYELRDVLSGDEFANDRAALLGMTGPQGADRVRYLLTLAFNVVDLYSARHRQGLDYSALVTAVAAAAQEAHRGRRPGNLKKGVLNHRNALLDLLDATGIERPSHAALGEDYRDAVAIYRRES